MKQDGWKLFTKFNNVPQISYSFFLIETPLSSLFRPILRVAANLLKPYNCVPFNFPMTAMPPYAA